MSRTSNLETAKEYKNWVLNLVDDLRAPDKSGFKIVVKNGEQRRREYEDAKAKAAKTGNPADIENAKRLKGIVEVLDNLVKARDLTDKAQALYENVDSNRKKLAALKALGEGKSEEAKKIQRQLERARQGIKDIEVERDAFGPKPKATPESESTVTPVNKNKSTTQATSTTTQNNARTGSGTSTGTGSGTGSGENKTAPSTFNVGTFRQADEASMAEAEGVGSTGGGTLPPSTVKNKTPLGKLLEKTEFWYDLPDYVFNLDKDLGNLLVEAVDGGWDNEKFLAKAKLTPWWQKNADKVRVRIVDRAKYDELKAAGEDVSKTDYGMYLAKQMRNVKAKAKEIAGVALTDEQAQSVVQKIYDGFLDDDPVAINALITPFISKVSSIAGTGTKSSGFSGQALQNYQTLQSIAKANGFTIKDILPNVSALTAGGDLETAVLRGLANGDIDINRVAQDARMLAAQGQPQYVRDLLNQGYDLQDVYAPYRKTMATTLDLNPDEIDLNDPTLRMAITDKGDMNLYDFKKALRQDNRWQYTEQAHQDVSEAALNVLRDFGFQG